MLLSSLGIKDTWLDPINIQNKVLSIKTYSNRCVQWGVLSKSPGSYLNNILQLSKPRVIHFIIKISSACRRVYRVCICLCVGICICVYGFWCKTRFKINSRWDTIKSPIQFCSVPDQPFSFFFFWLTALPLDFVLKECGHYHYFVTIQIFSQHVCSMNIFSHTVLICFDVSDSFLR